MQPLNQKKEATVALPVDHVKRKPDEEQEFDVMHAVAEDLIKAIHAHDTAGAAEALKAAFELSQPESEPMGEG